MHPRRKHNPMPTRPFREAVVTLLATLATLACAWAIAPGSGSAVLAVVLCVSLSRSHLDRDRRGRIEAAIALPLVGMGAVAIGALLQQMPWVGAALFVAGMFVSIWLRRFGPMATRIGSLIGLPFVALLVTPYFPPARDGLLPHAVAPIVVGLLALAWVSAAHALAVCVGFMRAAARKSVPIRAPTSPSSMRPVASTRMAIQMALALAVSFVVGFIFFNERWAWIVLTAFIVAAGNRGRLDVAYISVLRVLGTAAGTVIALGLAGRMGSDPNLHIVLILVAVFFGVWLRPIGYGWWAMFVTLAIALLQDLLQEATSPILFLRLEEILIGAAIAVASASFVLPVSSNGVLRRRMADALSALSQALDPATQDRSPDAFVAAIGEIEQLAPTFKAVRLVSRRFRAVQPADWIECLVGSCEPALAVMAMDTPPDSARQAVGVARKALREPAEIAGALRGLREELVRGAATWSRSSSSSV